MNCNMPVYQTYQKVERLNYKSVTGNSMRSVLSDTAYPVQCGVESLVPSKHVPHHALKLAVDTQNSAHELRDI